MKDNRNRKNKFKRTLKTIITVVLSIMLFAILSMTLGIVISIYRPAMPPIYYESVNPDYWPTQEWKMSTPEEQGMDPTKLLEMVEFYKKEKTENEKIMIESITIVRNGYIVADIYLNPLFPKDTKHIIHSCTKSIMSALIGIAIEEGYIENVDVPVLDILNDKNTENIDARIKNLTVKDLLTMQTGLHSQDSYLYQWRGLFEMQKTDDWTEYILNLPMEVAPGTRFDYSNMASFLLSAIITKTTGMNTLSFTRKHLFSPLGIEDVKWERNPKDIYIGWARMWLKPYDMAKIGLLYLQKGKWNNEQIVTFQWIKESLISHSSPKKYRYVYNEENKVDYMVSGGLWLFTNLLRPFADGYGYQWWMDKTGMYSAVGVGGQFIIIAPKENLVVVFTSKLSGAETFLPAKMLKKYILPAIISNETITANKTAQNKLVSLSDPPSFISDPKPVPELPATALKISGEIYSLDPNPWKYSNLQLVFDQDRNYAEFSYTIKEDDIVNYNIGLDNVYQLTESNGDTYAAVGSWTSPNTLEIDYELIGYSTKGKWILTFDDDRIEAKEVGVTGTYTYGGKKQINE